MDIDKANAAPRCQHISDCGRPCGSPALRDQPFCYNHFRIHQAPPNPRLQPEAFIPQLETRESIELAVTNVSRALCAGDLTPQQANSIIRAIRLLQWVIKHDGEKCATCRPPVTELTDAMSDALHKSSLCGADTLVRASTAPASPSGEAKPLRAHCVSGGDTKQEDPPSPAGAIQCSAPSICELTQTSGTPLTSPPLLPAHSPGHESRDTVTTKIPPTPAGAPLTPWQSPLLDLPADAILTEKQLDYCRFVLRYGFQHPEYDDACHRLQHAVKRPQIGLGSHA